MKVLLGSCDEEYPEFVFTVVFQFRRDETRLYDVILRLLENIGAKILNMCQECLELEVKLTLDQLLTLDRYMKTIKKVYSGGVYVGCKIAEKLTRRWSDELA